MPSKKIGLELSRNEAIAVAEALASCGDSQAEHVALVIRNELGNSAEAREYYWTNSAGADLKIYQEANKLPLALVRNDSSGEWEVVVDANEWSEEDRANVERLTLVELMFNVLGDSEEGGGDDEE